MTPDEIKNIVENALAQGHFFQWWHFVLWMLFSGVGAYFGTYVREKGRNAATKEDVGRITDEIEKVKWIYAQGIELIREKQQLKLAAIEKRLEAHQKAYELWHQLVSSVHDSKKVWDTAVQCQDWWWENCLYLTSEARDAFYQSIFCAINHRYLIGAHVGRDEVMRNWNDIMKPGEEIPRAIDLPPPTTDGLRNLRKDEPEKIVQVRADTEEVHDVGRDK
jgi:hypothetical protein